MSTHAMLAALTQTPELNLSQAEADRISAAVKEVEKYYPVSVNPKYAALGNIVLVGASVYGPRLWMINARRQQEEKNRKAVEAANQAAAEAAAAHNGDVSSAALGGISMADLNS